MPNPLCSVVIPVFNGAQYLPETIESFLQQDYPEKELILVDDGSSDDSRDILESYSRHWKGMVRGIHNPENQGLVRTFQNGVHAAKGEFIAVCGHDDVMFPNRLAASVAAFQQQSSALVCSNAYYLYDRQKTKEWVDIEHHKSGYIPKHHFLYRNPVIGPTVTFRKSIFHCITTDVLRFRNAFEWIYYYQYARQGGVYFLALPLVYYRKHSRNLTGHFFQSEEFREYRQFCRRRIASTLSPREISLATARQIIKKVRRFTARQS